MKQYQKEYESSLSDPSPFWADKAQLIDWCHQPHQILK